MFGCTYFVEDSLNTEMHYYLHFYSSGKEMASALNVTVVLKEKLRHFIDCNTGNGVQHVNNHDEEPKRRRHNSFQALKGGRVTWTGGEHNIVFILLIFKHINKKQEFGNQTFDFVRLSSITFDYRTREPSRKIGVRLGSITERLI